MATTRRVRLHTDERRTQLLELGTRVFASRPYDEIAMDELAEMGGVSKGLLYHYFRSKREFFVETIRAASLHLRGLTEPDSTLAPGARLRAAIDAHLDYVREHGTIYTIIYRSGTSIAPEVQDILDEHRGIVMQWLLLNLGMHKPKPLLRSALRAWIASVEGMSLDWIDHPGLHQTALRELLVASYGALLKRAESLISGASPGGDRVGHDKAGNGARGSTRGQADNNGRRQAKAKRKPDQGLRSVARTRKKSARASG